MFITTAFYILPLTSATPPSSFSSIFYLPPLFLIFLDLIIFVTPVFDYKVIFCIKQLICFLRYSSQLCINCYCCLSVSTRSIMPAPILYMSHGEQWFSKNITALFAPLNTFEFYGVWSSKLLLQYFFPANNLFTEAILLALYIIRTRIKHTVFNYIVSLLQSTWYIVQRSFLIEPLFLRIERSQLQRCRRKES